MKKLFWFSSSFVSLNKYMQSTQYIIRVQYMFLSLPSVPRPLIFVDHISNKHKQGFLFVCCDGNNAACTSGTKGRACTVPFNTMEKEKKGPTSQSRVAVIWPKHTYTNQDFCSDFSAFSFCVCKPFARKTGYELLIQYKQVS